MEHCFDIKFSFSYDINIKIYIDNKDKILLINYNQIYICEPDGNLIDYYFSFNSENKIIAIVSQYINFNK